MAYIAKYPFKEDKNNHASDISKFSFTYIGGNIDTENKCLSGNILGAYDTFSLNIKDKYTISLDYKYVSNAAGDWNNVFSFGNHINLGGGDVMLSPRISFNGNTPNSLIFYAQKDGNDISKWHNYKIKSDGKTMKYYIDNVLKDTVDMSNIADATRTRLYMSGGGTYHSVNCQIKNFVIKLGGDVTQVYVNHNDKSAYLLKNDDSDEE
jgi:hypothetical protein